MPPPTLAPATFPFSVYRSRATVSFLSPFLPWPLHDIAITTIVWSIAYARGGQVDGCMLRIRRAIVLQ